MKPVLSINYWASAFTLMLLFVGCNLPAQKNAETFDDMLKGLLDYSVPYVTVEELKGLDNPILLDAREKSEFEVSHIEGARWVGYNTFSSKRVADLNKKDTIVIYCSVGYRSEKIGEKLQNLGFSNVYNLYGSIFQWVNEGNSVVNDKGATKNVHAFDKDWGKWLLRGTKVY